MLAYEKGAIKQVPRRGGVMLRCHLLLVGSYIADSEYRRRSSCQRLYSLMFYHHFLFCSLRRFVRKNFYPSPVQRAVFVLQVHSLTAHKVRHFIWNLLSFSLIFFEVRESRRGGNLDFVAESGKCYQRVGGEGFLYCCICRKFHVHRELHGAIKENS